MNQELLDFATRLCELIANPQSAIRNPQFSELALELFALQFKHNVPYRKVCEARDLTPDVVEQWAQIPAVPATAFKELELSCILPGERTAVFHSSGTTEQRPSRHFHCPASLGLYEASLWSWFEPNVLRSADVSSASSGETRGRAARAPVTAIFLTPPPGRAPHSSLVHMFEAIRQRLGAPESAFVGKIAGDGTWILDFDAVLAGLRSSLVTCHPSLLLGTAFSFVHLLDFLEQQNLQFQLSPGSRVMETGGYKNRSRIMPKEQLHALIAERLGVTPENIICEYSMSELSSQAYAVTSDKCQMTREGTSSCHPSPVIRHFEFPPWARLQIISPETGQDVADGETGLIRVFDLANVFSVMAIQTEDLAVRRGDGFELIGRAQMAEPRGCSLVSA